MRNKLMLALLTLIILMSTANAALFGDRDQLIKVENELHEQQQSSGDWMIIAGILGIGCTVLFGIGAAIGSKARKKGGDQR